MFGMVTAYFDDSGTGASDSVVVVAGYIGSVFQWQKFNMEWSWLLSQFGVSQMHRAELESFHGDFYGWTPERRSLFVNKAQQIIKRRTYVALGCAVIKEEFETMFPDNLKRFYAGAYGFCATLCLARARRWFDKTNQKDAIDWVFEAGTQGSGQIGHLLNALYSDVDARRDFRLRGWSFSGKDVLPLQAADVIAYEMFKHATNQLVTQPRRNVRISFQHLVRSQDEERLEYWTNEDLEEYLKHPVAQNLIKDLTDRGF